MSDTSVRSNIVAADTDIAITFLSQIPLLHMEWFALPEAVEEFAAIMEEQLDMRREAANLDKFRWQVR